MDGGSGGKSNAWALGSFVGNFLFEGFYAIEGQSVLASVPLGLPDGFEVTGGEIADLFERGPNVRRKPSFWMKVFTEELFFTVVGERQEFDLPCEAT